ncbi:hypothetical protein [Cellulomonas composti]|uniref:Uncharacterized protein n=1 Tax=Cellulomonas composti TaxID=266130 RepID=A0A511JBD8_9CELL|nr:hypothetical protein [Cellulomonas composti]GEL95297.1 hypothetical protein CCO02nite_19550 [Cellulomonas composti]
MGDNTTGHRVEATIKVYMTWDVAEQRWIADSINDDGWPLDYAAGPELVDEPGDGTEADLAAACRSHIFAADLYALLAVVLGR